MEERSSTDKPGNDREREREKLCYIKSFVMLGPTGQLVLSANIKKYNVLVLCYSNKLSLDLDDTCIATLHEMATLF